MDIGKRIKSARKAKGLTQKQLAEAVGVVTGTIQQYELGKRQPRIEQIEKIAEILGVSLSDLIGFSEFLEDSQRAHIKNKIVDTAEVFSKLSLSEQVQLISSLSLTLDYIDRISPDEQREKAFKQFAELISAYGRMALNSFKMIFSSIERPNEYIIFIRNYTKAIDILGDYKHGLINEAIHAFGEENKKLQELIYGNDSEEESQ